MRRDIALQALGLLAMIAASAALTWAIVTAIGQ